MARPAIGTSISHGFERGLDRFDTWGLPACVIGAVSAGVSALVYSAQLAIAHDTHVSVADALDGRDASVASVQLLSLAAFLVSVVLSVGGLAVFAGAFHRERHGSAVEVPSAGAVLSQVIAQFLALTPKVLVLWGPLFVALAVAAFTPELGGVLMLGAVVLLLHLSVRWIWAPVISGAGEASGDDAFARSDQVVAGSWWGTFWSLLLIALATTLPTGIVGGILQAIMPGDVLGLAVSDFVTTVGSLLIFGSAIEAAWASVEGEATPTEEHPSWPAVPPSGPTTPPSGPTAPSDPGGSSSAPVTPPSTPPYDPSGPFL